MGCRWRRILSPTSHSPSELRSSVRSHAVLSSVRILYRLTAHLLALSRQHRSDNMRRTTLTASAVLMVGALLGWLVANAPPANLSAQDKSAEKPPTGGSPILPVPDP